MPTQTQTHRSKVAHGQVSKRLLCSSPHYLHMSLNNQLPANDVPVHWNLPEEKAMIDYLVEHKASAGDGFTFKDATWTKVAEHLQPLRTEGGVKTGKKCKEKWGRVSTI